MMAGAIVALSMTISQLTWCDQKINKKIKKRKCKYKKKIFDGMFYHCGKLKKKIGEYKKWKRKKAEMTVDKIDDEKEK